MDYYENQTLYDILGLPKDGKNQDGDSISFDSIARARDRLKYGNEDDRVPFSMWSKIDQAYDVLSDPVKRANYDNELEKNTISNDYSTDINDNNSIDDKSDFNSVVPFSLKVNRSIQNDFDESLNDNEYPSLDSDPIESKFSNDSVENTNETKVDLPFSEQVSPILNRDIPRIIPRERQSEPVLNWEIPEITPSSEQSESSLNQEIPGTTPHSEETQSETNDMANTILEKMKYRENENAKLSNFDDFKKLQKKEIIAKILFTSAIGFTISFAPGAVVAGTIAGIYIKRKLKKSKLNKQSYTGIITDVKTAESKLISKSNEKLKKSIDKLLQQNSSNFVLQKYKLRYENQMELLKQMIELRKNAKKKDGQFTNRNLKIKALNGELRKMRNNLDYVNKKIRQGELLQKLDGEQINPMYIRNLTIGNKYLELKNLQRKIKVYGGIFPTMQNGFVVAKEFATKKVRPSVIDELEHDEDQLDSTNMLHR